MSPEWISTKNYVFFHFARDRKILVQAQTIWSDLRPLITLLDWLSFMFEEELETLEAIFMEDLTGIEFNIYFFLLD